MNKLCNKLVTTYNTTVLDEMDNFTQAVFLNEAQKYKDGDKGKTVLMDLIYNHYNKKKPMPRFIGGPYTLTMHWSDKYQKLIYIFGEYHSNITNCELFPDFTNKNEKKTKTELQDGCVPGSIRNPKTNKCVKESGAIGKEIIKNNDKLLPQPKNKSMLVEDFLEQLILNTDTFIDIYFEFPSYKGEEYQVDYWEVLNSKDLPWSRLSALLKHMNTCMVYAKRAAKKCRLARVHYLDVRKGDIDEDELNDISWFRTVMKIPEFQNILGIIDLLKIPRVVKILKSLGTSSKSDFTGFWRDQVLTNRYVTKELAKSTIGNEIKEFIIRYTIEDALKSWEIWKLNVYKVFNGKDWNEIYSALNRIYYETVSANARVTDAYALARMFKKFDIKKKAARDTYIDQPIEPHNIIIYAGDAHSETYRDFLTHIGFKTISSVNSSKHNISNCINMKDFPQPFFSYTPENKGFFAKLFNWL